MNRLYDLLPVFAQNLSCTAAGIPRYHARFNRHFERTLAEWERSIDGPIEALHEIQRRRLDALVERARAHVPFYRDLPLPAAGRDPLEAMRKTLTAIPPLEKHEYREQPRAFLARDVPRLRLQRGRTSGTTGTALPLWHSRENLAEEYATVWRLRRACGVSHPSAPNLTFNGNTIVPFGQAKPPFWRTNAYGSQTLFSIFHMTPKNLGDYVDAVHQIQADYVQGYPSSIHVVARALIEQGRPLPQGRIKAVFTSSESLLAFQRQAIETAFGAPVRDRYGVSELGVSMTECKLQRLHVDMEFGIVEVDVTDETDEYVRGPLLITGLANPATPMLRYRIGDVGTRAKAPCACGRPGDVFLDVDGRIEDYVLTADGRLIGRLDHVFKDQLDVAEAQIRQDSRESIDVLVVPRDSYTDASGRHLLRNLRERLGPEIGIHIEMVDSIPREANGKFRAVKSQFGGIGR